MRIIELSGKMGAGKDYVADQLMKALKKQDLHVERLAFADPLRKELNLIIKGIKSQQSIGSLAKDFKVTREEMAYAVELLESDEDFDKIDFYMENRPRVYRELCQYWGTNVRRARNKNYWVDKIIEEIIENSLFTDVFIITDARFPNEITEVVDKFPYVYTIRLKADDSLREHRVENRDDVIPTAIEKAHASENAIDDDDTELMKIFDEIDVNSNNSEEIVQKILKGYRVDEAYDNDISNII